MKYSTVEVRDKAVRAYLKGKNISSISEMYHMHRTTVFRWIKKYEHTGVVEREKSPGSGRPSKLTEKQIKKLLKIILKPASDHGFETDFWTIKRIITIAKKKLRVNISKTTMYGVLYNESFSYKKPEKRFYEADRKKQEEWIKKEIPKIKRCVKKHKGILYFEDESSISLTAVLGKTWGPIGETIIQKSTGNRASISAMSAITNTGKLIFTLHEKRIASPEVINFLEQMLKHHPRRDLIVVMDNAATHTSKMTKAYIKSQKRLHVYYLPPRSPEFNPDEKVWNYLKNEELKSHKAKTKSELQKLTKKKLSVMSKKPELLRGIFMRCEISYLF